MLPRAVVALIRGERMYWQPTPFTGESMARLYEDPIRGDLELLVRWCRARNILPIIMLAWSTATLHSYEARILG